MRTPARLLKQMPQLARLTLELLEGEDRENGFACQRLEVALPVGGACLNKHVILREGRGRLLTKLTLDRAAARDLKDDLRLADPKSVPRGSYLSSTARRRDPARWPGPPQLSLSLF